MINPVTLPTDHPLRNKPLLGARTRWKNASPNTQWKEVEKSWPISKVTFNDLSSAWTDHWDWEIPE